MNSNRVNTFIQHIHSHPSISSTLSITWSQLSPTLTRLLTLPSSSDHVVESGSDLDNDHRMSDTDHHWHSPQLDMHDGDEDIKSWFTPDVFMSLYTQVFEYCASEPLEFIVDDQPVDREYILYSKLYTFLHDTLSSWCSSILTLSTNDNHSSQQHDSFEVSILECK